jgi:gamma-glutamylcyclotransferase (GGCT)/AIG2-like uncharacterized protein YtfP
VLGYLGASDIRAPLLVNGDIVRCQDVPQQSAIPLAGVPGPDRIAATTVTGTPHADDWPDGVFVYGTLRPGGSAWPVAKPWCVGEPVPAELSGTLYDTGLGWPALRFTGTGQVPGWLLRLRSPSAAFAALDEYEGSEYRRVRVVLADGTLCWTYEWSAPTDGMPAMTRGW